MYIKKTEDLKIKKTINSNLGCNLKHKDKIETTTLGVF